MDYDHTLVSKHASRYSILCNAGLARVLTRTREH